MPQDKSHSVKVWAGIILFFGIGALLALAVAFRIIANGGSVFAVAMLGACVGGYGAWFVFYVVLNAVKRTRGMRHSTGP